MTFFNFKKNIFYTTLLGILFFYTSIFASPTTTTYVPQTYVTVTGSDGGEPVAQMQQINASGMTDNPSTYVKFYAKTAGADYNGYSSFTVTQPSQSITALQVLVNYRGPALAQQTWTWSIYDWVYDGWVTVGNNAKAFSWGPWSQWTFNIGGPFANYVNSTTGEVRIQLASNNSADDVELDYEALVVTSDPSAPTPGTHYFVSTTGSDNNPGTLASPWRTISKAAKTVPAGSTVYVMGGVYNERVAFTVSGNAAAGHTTFMSYPGQSAIIDATGVKLPSNPGVAPTGLVEIANCNYLIVQGFEIRNINTNSSNLFPAGVSIWGTSDHIEIRHNYIHNITNGKNGAHGMGVYGTSTPTSVTNLTIDGNELAELTLGQSESMALNGNINGFTVSNNLVHDSDNIGMDAIGFEGTCPNSTYDQARNGSFIQNLVYNINSNINPLIPKTVMRQMEFMWMAVHKY